MALAQWADPNVQFYGKYIGSAFTFDGNNAVVVRNPTAANKLRPEQFGRRWSWSRGQRFYKNLTPQQLADLTVCGQNNPTVNSRGEVVFHNRYHKYLQIAVFEWEISGTLPPEINTSAAPLVDYFVTNLRVVNNGRLPGGELDLFIYVTGTLNGFPVGTVAAYIYLSKPVSGGVTRYTGSWAFITIALCESGSQFLTRTGNWWSRDYEPGSLVQARIDVIDFTRAYVITSQLMQIVIE